MVLRGYRFWRSFVRSRTATAAVEFAIIVPVMIGLAGGGFELSRAFRSYNAANRLATQYAFTWADCSDSPAGTCLTEMGTYTPSAALTNIVPQLTAANIGLRMFQITVNQGVVNTVYAYPTGATPTAAEQSSATSTLNNGQSGVIVSVSYVYNLMIFTTLMSPIIGSSYTMAFTVVQVKA
jgi:Flp pilus assembly protein TadG